MAWTNRQGGGQPAHIPAFNIDRMLKQPHQIPTSRGIPRRRSTNNDIDLQPPPYMQLTHRPRIHTQDQKQHQLTGLNRKASPERSMDGKDATIHTLRQALAKCLFDHEQLEGSFRECYSKLQATQIELHETRAALDETRDQRKSDQETYEANIVIERQRIEELVSERERQVQAHMDAAQAAFIKQTNEQMRKVLTDAQESSEKALEDARRDAREALQRNENMWQTKLELAINAERKNAKEMIEEVQRQMRDKIDSLEECHREEIKTVVTDAIETERNLATALLEDIRKQSRTALESAETQAKTKMAALIKNLQDTERLDAEKMLSATKRQLEEAHRQIESLEQALQRANQRLETMWQDKSERQIVQSTSDSGRASATKEAATEMETDPQQMVTETSISDEKSNIPLFEADTEPVPTDAIGYKESVSSSTDKIMFDANAGTSVSGINYRAKNDINNVAWGSDDIASAFDADFDAFGNSQEKQSSNQKANVPNNPFDEDLSAFMNTATANTGKAENLEPEIVSTTANFDPLDKADKSFFVGANNSEVDAGDIDPFSEFEAIEKNPFELSQSTRGVSFTDWDGEFDSQVTDAVDQLSTQEDGVTENDEDAWDNIWGRVSRGAAENSKDTNDFIIHDPLTLRKIFSKIGHKVSIVSFRGVEAKLTSKGIMCMTNEKIAFFFPDIASFAKYVNTAVESNGDVSTLSDHLLDEIVISRPVGSSKGVGGGSFRDVLESR
jgi:hypothetical protein